MEHLLLFTSYTVSNMNLVILITDCSICKLLKASLVKNSKIYSLPALLGSCTRYPCCWEVSWFLILSLSIEKIPLKSLLNFSLLYCHSSIEKIPLKSLLNSSSLYMVIQVLRISHWSHFWIFLYFPIWLFKYWEDSTKIILNFFSINLSKV